MGSSITTAKSSEVNMLVPGASPEDDMVFFCDFLLSTILFCVDAAIAIPLKLKINGSAC